MAAEGCPRAGHRPATLVVLVALIVGCWFGSVDAGAVVVNVHGHNYGVTPIHGVNVESSSLASRIRRSSVTGLDTVGSMLYHGGPVMHSVNDHVVFWDPNKEFTTETKEIVEKFFTDVAHDSGAPNNFLGIGGQYTDGTGRAGYTATFAGAKVDSAAYPATENCRIPVGVDEGPPYTKCLFDFQVQNALKTFVEAEKLATGPAQQYFVLTPHKVVTCFDEPNGATCSNNFYCAYHSSIAPGTAGEIIYADIPFSLLDTSFAKGCQGDGHSTIQLPNGNSAGTNETTRYADVALKYMSHEYIEASTDPLGNAYFDSHGQEIGDKCNVIGSGEGRDPNAFLPTLGGEASQGNLFDQEINAHHYYLQSEWDNAANACTMRPVPLSGAAFTATPATGVAGVQISFKGTATDIYEGLGAVWKWGDGTESTGLTPTHTYAAPGSYEVTMTAKDESVFLTSAPVVHTIVVSNPVAPPPPPPVEPARVPTTTTTTTTTSTSTSTSTSTTALVAVSTTPDSSFSGGSTSFNQANGELTFTQTVGEAGTFSWLLTFQNGKFGVYSASTGRCKAGQVRLAGKCRRSKIVFARGSQVVLVPGAVTIKLKPSASALKGLKAALKQKKGLPVTATLTFQSARGGSPVSHTQTITVRLKKR